jgi:hypothetical protein
MSAAGGFAVSGLERVSFSSLLAGDHAYLTAADECHYIHTYRCRAGNDLRSSILAFKKSEVGAVRWVVGQLRRVVPSAWLTECTFVPIPSSSGSVRACMGESLRGAGVSDVRPALLQLDTFSPSSFGRRSPPHALSYSFLEEFGYPLPRAVVVFDDVLSSGAHFRSVKKVLRARWDVDVIGLFVCRTCSLWRRCRLGADDESCCTLSMSNPRCHLASSRTAGSHVGHAACIPC